MLRRTVIYDNYVTALVRTSAVVLLPQIVVNSNVRYSSDIIR